ncbi:MAG: DNA polymerase III subunit alpha [Candidatus Eisenbacteria bacterium]
MVSCYAPLHLQSNYSLLRGTSPIRRLAERLREAGFEAAALADRNNLYGTVLFHTAAREFGLKTIVAAEVDGKEGERLVLVARNRTGYGNLCRVITKRMMDENFDLAAAVEENGEGLFLLCEDPALAGRLRPRASPGALWIEIPLWAGPREVRSRRAAARKLGVGVVAGGATALRGPEDGTFQKVLAAIRVNGVVGKVPPEELADPKGYLRPPGEAARLFAEMPEALANTIAVAEACELDLTGGPTIFPRFPLPEGETPYSWLHRLSQEGLRRRYGTAITPEVTRRLQRELETIDRMAFPEYFLVVGDLVRFARSRGIPVVGRGSGASSLVAYVLGITSVDPIRYRLYFERFLNSLRDDWPDLDVDLCWRGRDEVIEYAYDTFGRDRVAMISTHNHCHPRSAFRDTARAFGLPQETVNRISRRIPRETDGPLEEVFRTSRLLADYPRDQEPYRAILRFAEEMRGFPRHLGIHCGGIVIADRPIDLCVPLEEATKGIVVTQYEMDAVEATGLVKIDLLGNRAISTIRETLRLVKENRGGEEIDIETIPHDDEKTAALLGEGRTLGCFQIESPGMRNLLRMIGTKNMGSTIAAHSLIRPGPASSGMKEKFVRRVHGLEPVDYPHPDLEDLLGETLGIMLYEEDVMAVASRIAGISLEEGDLLRRKIGKARDEASMKELADRFLAQAIGSGVHPKAAKEIWALLARFSSYSFCRAHASGYGVLAYQTAYLKAHYGPEHVVALLNNHQGMYPTRVHLEEARRRGIEVKLPSVNRSEEEFSLDGGGVRVGLSFVRNLSAPVRERIHAGRPFRSLADFVRRVRPPRREAENLALVGAFDGFGVPRTGLLWELYGTYEERRKEWMREPGMFDGDGDADPARPKLREFDLEERLRHELAILGMAVSAHPVALLRTNGKKNGFHDSGELRRRGRGEIRLLGVAAASRRVITKRKENMLFLTLEDEHDLVECTLFPKVFRRYAAEARGAGPFAVEGTIEEQYGVRTVNVRRLESLAGDEPILGEMLEEEGRAERGGL